MIRLRIKHLMRVLTKAPCLPPSLAAHALKTVHAPF